MSEILSAGVIGDRAITIGVNDVSVFEDDMKGLVMRKGRYPCPVYPGAWGYITQRIARFGRFFQCFHPESIRLTDKGRLA